jgi:acetyltransferase
MSDLEKLFNPKRIAVIGASDRKGSVGYALMDNLINSDYDGIVFPVNVNRDSVHNIRAYKSIKDIGEQIDLAIIATPAKTVPAIVKECGEAKLGGVVIISAGFSEAGKEGEEMTEEILEYARAYNIRVIGPNCLGFMRPVLNLNASFASQNALPGRTAFISQSGALCTAILDWSVKNNVGFNYFVSIGSMVDVGFHDLIDYFGSDPDTDSILIYMESLSDARKFMSAARAFARSKPIIVLKSGRSAAGAKAAKSHTGTLAGNDQVFDAAFERAGVVRVDTIVSLFHTAKALAMQPRPKGRRMAVITNAGGPGVIAADALIFSGGQIANLEKNTIDSLDEFLPENWSHGNPVDILGDACPEVYAKTLEVCLKDKNTDAILIILTPQAMTNPSLVAEKIVEVNQKYNQGKTILASWIGGHSVLEGRGILEKGNVPIYRQPEDAIKSFMYICNYSKNLELLYETPATIPHAFTPDIKANKKIIAKAAEENRLNLNEAETKEFLRNYQIPVTEHRIAKTQAEAREMSSKAGFPAAMKILSPDILHKTDIGGVVLNINSKDEAAKSFTKIMNAARSYDPDAKIDGVLIEPMINKKYELLIGSKKDPLFGPVIVFGMGGVAVEIFKDTKIGLPPLNMSLSLNIIRQTKIYKLLKGYRNMPGVDIQSLQFLLYKFAYLIADFPEIEEIDINPFSLDENGGIVLDAKVVLDKSCLGKNPTPYAHLVISPYPKEYIYQFEMKNAQTVEIRPIKPEDEPMEAEMFKTFSQETQKHRFFKEIKHISHELLQRYTQIDYDREMALVAFVGEGDKKKMIGVVRLISHPYDRSAEFAIVVGDPWQNQGLGGKFTDHILEIAKHRGVDKVYAKFMPDNQPMLKIFKDRKFDISEKEGIGYAELKF